MTRDRLIRDALNTPEGRKILGERMVQPMLSPELREEIRSMEWCVVIEEEVPDLFDWDLINHRPPVPVGCVEILREFDGDGFEREGGCGVSSIVDEHA